MSEARYTPGPWRVILYDAGDRPHWSGVPSIQAADEYDCAIVHWDGFKQEYWQSARGDREMLANATLIAAAPDLVEALRAASALATCCIAQGCYSLEELSEMARDTAIIARSALTKAGVQS